MSGKNANIKAIQEKARAKIEEERAKFQSHQAEKVTSQKSETTPTIIVTDRYLHHVSDEGIMALKAANNPPFLFVRSGALVRITKDEKRGHRIVNLNEAQLCGILARAAFFERKNPKGRQVATSPPRDLVQDILSLGEWPFPTLEGIAQTPFLRGDGTVLMTPGYDPPTWLYYVPPPDLFMPPIPESPAAGDIEAAIGLIQELLVDFCFLDDSDRANALGLIFTLPLRPAITGNVPLAAITAPTPGTGKSLLTEIVSLLGTGRVSPMAGMPKDEDEMRKYITSRLLTGDPFIAFDNLELPLGSPNLSRALTCQEWEDRYLGKSLIVRMPQRAVWLANGNNLRLKGDLPRRTYPIRLDSHLTRPWARDRFRHKDLSGWLMQHRGELLAAILTIGRAWFVAGKPEPSEAIPVMGGFEAWANTIGGILSFAGVEGFLENLRQFHEESDLENQDWELFINAWAEMIGNKAITCQECEGLLKMNAEFAVTLPEELEPILNDRRKSFARTLGRALAKREKRPYGEKSLAFQRAGEKKRAALWRVAPIKAR
jgi:hypothetical protein